MKKLFDLLVNFIKKLPVAAILKPIWKSLLKSLINAQIDYLENSLVDALERKGSAAIDRNIDYFQKTIITKLDDIKILPENMKKRIELLVQEEGDRLQDRLKSASSAFGPRSINGALSISREVFASMIDKL